MAFYAYDDLNNRVETLSKEEIYALLAAAIQQGQLPQIDQNTAFVTMIKSIVDGKAYKQAYCTQAQYNELVAAGTVQADTSYIITDDDSYNELVNAINNLAANIASIQTTLENLKVSYKHNLKVTFKITVIGGEELTDEFSFSLDNSSVTHLDYSTLTQYFISNPTPIISLSKLTGGNDISYKENLVIIKAGTNGNNFYYYHYSASTGTYIESVYEMNPVSIIDTVVAL